MHKKVNFFGKKLPAWLLLAALVVVGAGAATGLVLKDSVNGTTTIAVSQALTAGTPTGGGDADEFLGTVDDDGMTWNAHFEANNGDTLTLSVPISNAGGTAGDNDEIYALLVLQVPDGITVNIEGDTDNADVENPVRIDIDKWKFGVDDATTNTLDFTIALEDALPTGFYTITGTIVPLNS